MRTNYTYLMIIISLLTINIGYAQEEKLQSNDQKTEKTNKFNFRFSDNKKDSRSDNENINNLKDSIERIIIQKTNDSLLYEAKINTLLLDIDSLRSELNTLHVFRKEFVRKQLNDSQKIMHSSFNDMNIDEIDVLITLCLKYEGDKDFDIIKDKLKAVRTIKEKYDKYSNLVCSKIDRNALSEAASDVNSSLTDWKKICTTEQMIAIDSIKTQLDIILNGVDVFARIINDINIELETDRSASSVSSYAIMDANVKIDDILKSYSEYIDYYFSKLPYLNNRYTEYLKELKINPIKPNTKVLDIEKEMRAN